MCDVYEEKQRMYKSLKVGIYELIKSEKNVFITHSYPEDACLIHECIGRKKMKKFYDQMMNFKICKAHIKFNKSTELFLPAKSLKIFTVGYRKSFK